MSSLGKEISNQTIVVTGFSKSHGLAGLRIGVLMASNEAHFNLLMAASNHQSTIHGSNVLAQVAATAAVTECDYWLTDFITHLAKMRSICVDGLNAIDGFSCFYPQGCYVAFADITKTGYSSIEMQQLLLDKAKVAVVPGLQKWFGARAEGFIRLSFATSEETMVDALSRINHVIKCSK